MKLLARVLKLIRHLGSYYISGWLTHRIAKAGRKKLRNSLIQPWSKLDQWQQGTEVAVLLQTAPCFASHLILHSPFSKATIARVPSLHYFKLLSFLLKTDDAEDKQILVHNQAESHQFPDKSSNLLVSFTKNFRKKKFFSKSKQNKIELFRYFSMPNTSPDGRTSARVRKWTSVCAKQFFS